MKKISITINDDLSEKLKDLKDNHHVNLSSFITSAIKEKLEKEKPLEK